MKGLTLALAAAAVALALAGPASADPLNKNTTSFTGTCVGFAGGTAVHVEASLDASPHSRVGLAFQILGSQQVVLAAEGTPGLERRAQEEGTSCVITEVNCQSIDPFTVLVVVV